MSKKRRKKKVTKEKQVRISASLHRSLKIAAAEAEIKLSELAERKLRDSLEAI